MLKSKNNLCKYTSILLVWGQSQKRKSSRNYIPSFLYKCFAIRCFNTSSTLIIYQNIDSVTKGIINIVYTNFSPILFSMCMEKYSIQKFHFLAKHSLILLLK